MLRLIALAVLAPSIALASPPPTKKVAPLTPDDLRVSAEEHALRDLMPGWVPCRALTEDEMVWNDAPHRMRMGAFYFAGDERGAPVIPPTWITDWPEPGPLLATGVPQGWWWMPEDPEWFGAWIVLAQGERRGHRFYSMVTRPLEAVDYGRVEMIPPIRLLYAALRDREAKKRGTDPAVLDRDSELLARGGSAPPPSVLAQANQQAKRLDAQDRLEEAAALLEVTLDDGSGDDRLRAEALMRLAHLSLLLGDIEASRRITLAARPHALHSGNARLVETIDRHAADLAEAIRTTDEASRIALRAHASAERGRFDRAIPRLREALTALEDDRPEAELPIRRDLATALYRTADLAAARIEATRALALAERHDEPEIAAEMKALLARLGPADLSPPR